MRAIKHARISRAKGLYRYIPNICLYLYVFTCVFTSKRLIEKTCLFVESFEARYTEPLCGWYGHLGNRRYPLPACAYEKIRRGGLLVNYELFNKLYIVCKALLDAATFF